MEEKILKFCRILLIITILILVFSGALVITWHWITPTKYHFLNSDQLTSILLFFAGVGTTDLIKKWKDKK